MTQQPLLGAVFGGVLLGAGLGLILRGGATTGGTDMAARMIHNRFQHISVGAILFLIDCCVVLMAGFLHRGGICPLRVCLPVCLQQAD